MRGPALRHERPLHLPQTVTTRCAPLVPAAIGPHQHATHRQPPFTRKVRCDEFRLIEPTLTPACG